MVVNKPATARRTLPPWLAPDAAPPEPPRLLSYHPLAHRDLLTKGAAVADFDEALCS